MNRCSTVGSCPFAFTQESESIQNLGCLPTPQDIVSMRLDFGKTWACHDDRSKPCAGAIAHMKKDDIDCKVIDSDLLTLDDQWHLFVYSPEKTDD